ncbi:MAG: hypothetical protein OXC54_05535 [Rhodospirillaceae bacterium]|nr:hypothetical protein [Rhodospirillaceae bacterium]
MPRGSGKWRTVRIKVVGRPSHRKGPKTICVVHGGKGLLAALPFVCPAIPVQGCRAHKMRDRLKEFMLPDILEIVGKSKETAGFKLIPRRRVVARTFARRGRCRQFAGDFERSPESSLVGAQRASSPTCSESSVRKAITSCLVSASISSMRAIRSGV